MLFHRQNTCLHLIQIAHRLKKDCIHIVLHRFHLRKNNVIGLIKRKGTHGFQKLSDGTDVEYDIGIMLTSCIFSCLICIGNRGTQHIPVSVL